MEDRLSEFLLNRIREIDECAEEETDPKERESDARFRQAADLMTRHLLGCLEGFADTTGTKIQELFESVKLTEEILDDHYSRELLRRVPNMVDRTLRQGQILPEKLPSTQADLYLRDATRSYIFELWTASVSLCRAAVEQSLVDLMEQHGAVRPWRFKPLVDTARAINLLDEPHAILAKKVGDAAGDVLHGKRLEEASAESMARETLCSARGVLAYLYSDKKNAESTES